MSLWTQAIAGPLAAAVAAMPPGRRLVALAGPPGAGKSTLAAEAAAVLPGATVLPMDGYHLDDAILAERGILHRKGSPESFDAAGFLSLVRRLRDEAEVFHPSSTAPASSPSPAPAASAPSTGWCWSRGTTCCSTAPSGASLGRCST